MKPRMNANGREFILSPAKGFLYFSCLLAAILPVNAELATYDDFLRVAQKNNPGVQAAHSRWQAELSRAGVAGALPDPKLTYSYFIESVETRTGPQEHKAGISQQFPWFGKLDAEQKAQLARAGSAYEQYRSVQLKLAYDVRRVYADGWFLNRETELTQQNIELLKDIEGIAESRVRAGASATEVIKAQLERAQLEERLQTFNEKQIPVQTELNALLNRELNTPIPPIRRLDFHSIDTSAWPSLQANPALIALQHEQTGAHADLRAARKNGMPSFTVGLEWIGIGEAAVPTADSGKDAWMAGFGISLPIWRGRYRAEVERASYRSDMLNFARRQKENRLRTDLESTLAGYREAVRKISLYQDTILPKSEHLLKLNETDYRSGNSGFLDLIDTQRSILRYQLELARAQADSQIHLAKIEMLIGKNVDEVFSFVTRNEDVADEN